MSTSPLIGVIMGSRSDWETLSHTADTLDALGVPYEVSVVSAHRTPDLLFEYVSTAISRGLEVISHRGNEGIIRESVKPMERIEGIKILQVDGLVAGGGVGPIGSQPANFAGIAAVEDF